MRNFLVAVTAFLATVATFAAIAVSPAHAERVPAPHVNGTQYQVLFVQMYGQCFKVRRHRQVYAFFPPSRWTLYHDRGVVGATCPTPAERTFIDND